MGDKESNIQGFGDEIGMTMETSKKRQMQM
jgi:hypothetical protein